jgi:hypothetical protein
MSAAETIPMVRKRTAYHRFAPWGSAIEDSKNGWLCRLLVWGATSDSKQDAGERHRSGACTQHFNPLPPLRSLGSPCVLAARREARLRGSRFHFSIR